MDGDLEMNLAEYLFMEVTPLWPHGTDLNDVKRRPQSEDNKQRMRRTWLLATVDKYQKAFLHFNNVATSLQIANYLGHNSSSIAKSLEDMMNRTSYLTRTQQGRTYTWTWDRHGSINDEC
jgi:hypothetical protein